MNQRAYEKGFTLVEMIVVIVVIAILATIATFGTIQIQAGARDGQRSVSTTSLADALEKYFDKNGEYPSCSIMTGSADSLQSTLGVGTEVIKMPRSTDDNSIICSDISTSSGDAIAYVGDGTTKCTGSIACRYWTLKYKEESTGQIKSVTSKRQASPVVAPAAPASTTTTTISGTTASASATSVACSNATVQYRVDLQVNDGSWQEGTWGTGRSRSAATSQGAQYAYRTATRCVLPDTTEGNPTVGVLDKAVVPITTPSKPSLAKSASGDHGAADSVTWSWASNCPSGTSTNYSTAYYRDDSTGWRAWTDKGTATSQTQTTALQGWQYAVKAKLTCFTPYDTADSPESDAVSYIRNVDRPSRPTGFHVERKDRGRYDSGVAYWDGVPTCGTGLKRVFQVYYQQGYIIDNAGVGQTSSGSYTTWIFMTDASTPRDGFSGDPNWSMDNSGWPKQWYMWKTAWEDKLLAVERNGYDNFSPSSWYWSNPTIQGNTVWLDWEPSVSSPAGITNTPNASYGESHLKELRVYIRYACYNDTTKRYAGGEPGMSIYQYF